jgi:hypothetical protein
MRAEMGGAVSHASVLPKLGKCARPKLGRWSCVVCISPPCSKRKRWSKHARKGLAVAHDKGAVRGEDVLREGLREHVRDVLCRRDVLGRDDLALHELADEEVAPVVYKTLPSPALSRWVVLPNYIAFRCHQGESPPQAPPEAPPEANLFWRFQTV